MKKFIPLALSVLILVFVFNSCKKAEVDTDTQSAEDNTICEQAFSQVMPTVNSAAIKQPGVQKMAAGGCPEIYIDSNDTKDGFPVTMLLIYDTINGCKDRDGRTKKGKIECVFRKPWHNDTTGNDLITARFINYSVNDIKIEGTVIISKPSPFAHTTQVINGKCIWPTWSLSWNSTRTFNWVEGHDQGDTIASNDVFEITGSANGVNRKGESYSVNITSPLRKSASCAYITQGRMDITPQDRPVRTLDYGTGACDNDATVTINGNTFNIKLN